MIPAAILALVPGCEERPPISVQALPGGRGCNQVCRVDTDAGRFVLRQRRRPLDRPGAAAQTELRSQMAAAAAGFAPRIITAAPDGSWLLMDFIDAPLWTEDQLHSPEGVERLGLRLAQLHGLPVPMVPQLDAAGIAEGYLQQLHDRAPGLAEQYEPVLEQVQYLSSAIDGLASRAVLNHADLQPANMLGPEPVLIDWEYAQVADPTYDIACLLTYYPRLELQLPRLLECAGLAAPGHKEAVGLQRRRFACLNQLWEAASNS